MKKWLFNPFIYIAGARSLIFGWAVMLLTAFIGHFNKVHFDGVIDLHSGRETPIWFYFADQFIDWGCATLVFYIAGRIFSRSSVRLIDVAGTMALARWVWIIAVIIDVCFIPSLPENGSIQDIINSIGFVFIVGAFLMLIILVWFVALMYNAFSISCNLKGNKATGVFIVCLLIAEIISKIIFHFILLKS